MIKLVMMPPLWVAHR